MCSDKINGSLPRCSNRNNEQKSSKIDRITIKRGKPNPMFDYANNYKPNPQNERTTFPKELDGLERTDMDANAIWQYYLSKGNKKVIEEAPKENTLEKIKNTIASAGKAIFNFFDWLKSFNRGAA